MPPGKILAHQRSGSTLIEILLATAIIIVLLALLFPVFDRVRVNADTARCQRNLREIATAALLYASDNGGLLPDRSRWASETDVQRSILPYMGLTASQLKADSVLTCPAIQRSPYRSKLNFGHRTYSINQYATGSGYSDTTWEAHVLNRDSPLRLVQVKRPQEQAFFMDGTALKDSALGSEGYRYSVFQAPDRLAAADENNSSSWRTPYVHQGQVCVVFLDGHVELIDRIYAERELVGPTNPSPSQSHTSPRRQVFWGAEK